MGLPAADWAAGNQAGCRDLQADRSKQGHIVLLLSHLIVGLDSVQWTLKFMSPFSPTVYLNVVELYQIVNSVSLSCSR